MPFKSLLMIASSDASTMAASRNRECSEMSLRVSDAVGKISSGSRLKVRELQIRFNSLARVCTLICDIHSNLAGVELIQPIAAKPGAPYLRTKCRTDQPIATEPGAPSLR